MLPMLRFTVRMDSRSDQTALSETPRRLALVVALADVRFRSHCGLKSDSAPGPKSVESRCGAVALGRTYPLPALSSGGAFSGSTIAPFPHPAHRIGSF